MIITSVDDIKNVKVNIGERSIEFVDVNIDRMKGFSEIHADVIMRQISEQTGDKWGAVKLSGAWIISCVPAGSDSTWNPVYGHRGENTRKFTIALGRAMNKAIVQSVPFK
jgi:hypothetical protein